MADIFISYKREDRARIVPLAEALEARGYTVWWDLELVAGRRWAKQIKAELDAAKCVVVVWTRNSVASDRTYVSEWVENEADEGHQRRVLVPVLLDAGCIAWTHQKVQYADLVAWNEDPGDSAVDRLIQGVQEHAGRRARPEDVELSAWTEAERAGTAAALARFVEAYPHSRFAEVANNRLVERQEAEAWSGLGPSPTFSDLMRFVRQWPSGRFADVAEAKLEALASSPSMPFVPPGRAATEVQKRGRLPPRQAQGARAASKSSRSPEGSASRSAAPRERRVPKAERSPPAARRAGSDSPQVIVEPLTQMRFLPVPGGTFQMGADDLRNACKPVHAVTVSSFWLAETAVTNAQYRPFVQATGKKPKYWDEAKYNQDLQPVVGVTWPDATAYCEWLTAQFEGGWVARLPIEAWWERAARGDDNRPYPWGSAAPTPEFAWYGQDYSEDAPKPVGQYLKGMGPYGHLDLAGNVWEWCQDVWDEKAYQKPPHASGAVDPEVATGDAKHRVMRGGSFLIGADGLRSANRDRYRADDRDQVLGFRVCLAPPSTGGSGGGAP